MDSILKTILISIFTGTILAFVGYVLGRIAKNKDTRSDVQREAENERAEDARKHTEEIAELKRQVAVLKAEAVPIAAAFQAMLIAKLTHLHSPVTDALLTKSKLPSILTLKETATLAKAVAKNIANKKIGDESERIGWKIFLDVVEMAKIEAETISKSVTETVLVSQPATESPVAGKPEEEKKN